MFLKVKCNTCKHPVISNDKICGQCKAENPGKGKLSILEVSMGALMLWGAISAKGWYDDWSAERYKAQVVAAPAVAKKEGYADCESSLSCEEASGSVIAAVELEILEDLSARMKIDVIAAGLRSGDPTTLSSLPTKGYNDGLAGFLRQYHLYPNPDYSFTSCGDGALVAPPAGKPGCIVSVKLARKNADGSFRDTGVRIEYGVGLGSKSFQANNSAYAEHAISGDGLLQAQFQRP